jgi:hypothetical protein
METSETCTGDNKAQVESSQTTHSQEPLEENQAEVNPIFVTGSPLYRTDVLVSD